MASPSSTCVLFFSHDGWNCSDQPVCLEHPVFYQTPFIQSFIWQTIVYECLWGAKLCCWYLRTKEPRSHHLWAYNLMQRGRQQMVSDSYTVYNKGISNIEKKNRIKGNHEHFLGAQSCSTLRVHLTRKEHEGAEGGGHADTWVKHSPGKRNRRYRGPKVGVVPRENQRRLVVTGAETAKGSIRAEEVTKVMGAGSERS